ncbi:hypothetical protein BBJ28_00022298 [Nothophytophthora sp. Chile5]|nr:hypothetical protein BBJ28_00022298 [Nothophytophthora sp. Chile5]
MFSGHTKTEWTLVVNAWIVGGMVGSLCCGSLSERYGRKRVLQANAVFMLVGAIVQASASSIAVFIVGRFLAGIASGCATGMVGGYISEISPPHLRNSYGIGLQISFAVGLLLVAITFFFANTSSGWRYIAAFPVVNAGLFLVLAPFLMVESPAWLLEKGDHDAAEQELARLYGSSNVQLALEWMEPSGNTDLESAPMQEEQQHKGSVLSLLLSPLFRRQLLVAIGVASSQQISGINAVFYYSSDIFKDAGISDGRVGGVITNLLMVLPTVVVARLSERYGNRKLLLWGLAGMFISAAGMTLSLALSIQALSIVFTATFVGAFAGSLGPLIWSITAALFTDSVRATAVSICIFCNWTCNLMVGVFFPYISDGMNSYSFTPFMVIIAFFFMFTRQCVPETVGKTTEEIQAEFRKMREQKTGFSMTETAN